MTIFEIACKQGNLTERQAKQQSPQSLVSLHLDDNKTRICPFPHKERYQRQLMENKEILLMKTAHSQEQ